MDPITREEMFLSGYDLEPITRREKFLSKLSSGGAQADWNAAEGEPGHVLNRTHWVETGMGVILEETSPIYTGNPGAFAIINLLPFELGQEYTVTFNGTEYVSVCKEAVMEDGSDGGMTTLLVGNELAIGGNDSGEPFAIAPIPLEGMTMVVDMSGAESCTVKIEGKVETIHKLPSKFLEEPVPMMVKATNQSSQGHAIVNRTSSEIIEAVASRFVVLAFAGAYFVPNGETETTEDNTYVHFKELLGDNGWTYRVDKDGVLDQFQS